MMSSRLLAAQIHGKGALAITKAVAKLPRLASLQLDENEISEAAIAAIQVIQQSFPFHSAPFRKCKCIATGTAVQAACARQPSLSALSYMRHQLQQSRSVDTMAQIENAVLKRAAVGTPPRLVDRKPDDLDAGRLPEMRSCLARAGDPGCCRKYWGRRVSPRCWAHWTRTILTEMTVVTRRKLMALLTSLPPRCEQSSVRRKS